VRALTSGRFYGARAFQLLIINLLIVNFHMKIQEPLHSYFVGNQTSRKLEWNHSILHRFSNKHTLIEWDSHECHYKTRSIPILSFCSLIK
jgi:hypothetical protein